MSTQYQPVIGLEVHAVLETQSKMFCDCPLVDSTHHQPNVAVCPVCAGMPGMLPVLNKAAVDFALRVALALNCQINQTSIFARKSYFYPDLPKGFQISQYEEPLAENGWLEFETDEGLERVGIRRVHLEEDTGKLTHVHTEEGAHSLVDLNRSGVPLLEIVTEPELHSVKAVRAYAYALRSILRYLEVNSGNMEKGLLRIEPNVSIRPLGSKDYGTRAEIKNLNSFRSLERALEFELSRQETLINSGKSVKQQTLGWDDDLGETLPQRSKEVAEDYRYFPEPDLPPLLVEESWIEEVRSALPELPNDKKQRFISEFGLSPYDAGLLTAERATADFFEEIVSKNNQASPKLAANWITGPYFALMNENPGQSKKREIPAEDFASLLELITEKKINAASARKVLKEMFASEGTPAEIVAQLGLELLSDTKELSSSIAKILAENPDQVTAYQAGNEAVLNWLFGQAMAQAKGRANPQILRELLLQEIEAIESEKDSK